MKFSVDDDDDDDDEFTIQAVQISALSVFLV